MFELFVANRYLRAKRQQVMISVITVISVIGVATGVMALVIAIAITNGLRNTMERTLLAATAHVIVKEKVPGSGIEGWREIAQKLKAIPGVEDVTPALYDQTTVRGTINSSGVVVKGVTVEKGRYLPETLVHLKEGSFDGLRGQPDGLPGVILGTKLAAQIGASVGQTVNLTLLRLSGPQLRPVFERARVVGTFESGMFEFDNGWIFMAVGDVQRLWDYGDVVNAIEINLQDVYKAPEVAKEAEKIIGKDLAATTWQEQNQRLLEAFTMERTVTVITISLIQLVAALNILITLVMMVMEKHRDIAVLMSMGARASQIRKIFVYKGAIIGAIGTSIGLVLGYSLSFLANHYRWLRLDEEVYEFKFIPLEPVWADAIWIAALAMAVSLLATWYPAQSATKIAPVESMRYE